MRRREVLAVGNPGAMRRRWAMCCRWGECVVGGRATDTRPYRWGTRRGVGECDAVRHVATKKQVG